MTDGLLLIHAFPLDARMWDEQVGAFAGSVPTVAVNLPGFGGTPSVRHVMTMADAAEHSLDEMDRAGLIRAVVCGLSMGGYVALEMWRRFPQRIMGLVLANTRAEPDSAEGRERRRDIAELVLEQGTVAILDQMRTLVSLEASDDLWERVASIVASQPPEAVAAASLGMAARPDSRPDLPTIDMPTLVISSAGDRLIFPEDSQEMAEAIQDAQFEVIDGAGHLSNMERPDEFTALLERHLARCGLL